jgi:ribosomal protein S18 acetylase RimI-like enzyme
MLWYWKYAITTPCTLLIFKIQTPYICCMNNQNDSFAVERINIGEVKDLQEMSIKTFFDTFSWGTSPENMNAYLDTSLSLEKLTTELNHPESEFYFALLGNIRVGYLKLNFGQAQTELKAPSAMEIERIYILNEHQGKKIGQALLTQALEIAIQKKMEYVWLGVWEKNIKALSFYQKHGFVQMGSHAFMMGTEEQTDLIMKKDLNS